MLRIIDLMTYAMLTCGMLAKNYEVICLLSSVKTSLPYFGVKLSCVCLMFAHRKRVMTYSDPMVTYSHPKMTYSYPKVT